MNPLQFLEGPLRALLDFLAGPVGLTYGWAIVALTVIVRLLLLPLFVKQYRSMRRMQAYAPQLKEIQKRNKGDRQKLNEEMMAFYKENKINPFASCLPLLAQLPVFIALYYVLRNFSNDAEARAGEVLSFMWIVPDISQKLTEIGWGAAVVVGIYGLSQLLSTELSVTPNMSSTQRKLMRFLPLLIVSFVFTFPVPTGLVLYWMTTNLWTCGQQLVMKQRIGQNPVLTDDELATIGKSTQRTSRTPPKSGRQAEATPVDTKKGRGGKEAEAPAKGAPRKRVALDKAGGNGSDPARGNGRRRRRPAPLGQGASGDAPPATDAPAAREAPEPRSAPEPEQAPQSPPDAGAAGGQGEDKAGGGQRRRPRQGNQQGSRSSRPAQPNRRAPKKRR